jgi:cytochrome P450
MAAASATKAREEAYATPLDAYDMSTPQRFRDDTMWPYFDRMRKEAPLHYCRDSAFGPYWSITRYKDIMATDTNHSVFSSAGGISLAQAPSEEMKLPNFISMDPPEHDVQRKAVSPIVAPNNLAKLEGLIRQRVETILESLPLNQTFNWVDQVSIELTTQMLATLFDFPFEDRRLLTQWSDRVTQLPTNPAEWAAREADLQACLAYFVRLWNERVNAPPAFDLVSMLAHNPATRNMTPRVYLGNLMLLIVGGNDTTRNSITGGLHFLNQHPGEFAKVKADPSLIPNMVSEIIRYQTPLPYMRRTATQDFEMHGKIIKKRDKVVMWYVSGNRDDEVIDRPYEFLVDRKNARQHLSFGFGIHRCVGNRLAEMQLRVLWEEILKREMKIDVVGQPVRVPSSFIRGYSELPVRILR